MAGQLIHKRGDRWLLRVYKGRDPLTGKRQYKSITFKGDRNEARAELDRMLRAQKQDKELREPDQTLNKHLDKWFDVYASNHYRPNTFANYVGIIDYDVRPTIGHLTLSELKPLHLQKVFNQMKDRGVCSNTRRRLYSVLSTALDSAVRWGTLEENPAVQVQIPRREQKEMRALTRGEARAFLAITDKGRWSEYFRTSLNTGMRPGELAGLRWGDIDFENLIISVQRSLVWKGFRHADGWMLVPPKTERGRRQIAIPQSLAELLLRLKSRQEDYRRRMGSRYEDNDFVFTNRRGYPLYPRTFVRSVFKLALVRAGLPRTIRLYDLRHTCATLLLKSGEHIKVVSERLGHSNIAITLEIYVHILPGMQKGAAIRMESLLSHVDSTLEAHLQAHQSGDSDTHPNEDE